MATKLVTGPVDSYLCPICLEVPSEDVFLCINGHGMCSSCVNKDPIYTTRKCAHCREPLGLEPMRNTAFESILDDASFPCSHQNCKKFLKRQDLQRHNESCEHRPVNVCPRLWFEKCKEPIYSGEALRQHLKEVHDATDIIQKEALQWKNFITDFVNPGRCRRLADLFTSDDEHFLLNVMLILSDKNPNQRSTYPGKNGVLAFTVVYLGDNPEKADEFRAKVTVSTVYKSEKTRAHSWSGLPIHYKSLDVYSDICPGVSIPISYLKRSVESMRAFKESEDKTMEFDLVLKVHVSKKSYASTPSPLTKHRKTARELLPGVRSQGCD